jgi:hypothetical protein
MKIYLASRYSRRLELCGYREDLQQLGHEVSARWLNGGHQIDDQGRARPSADAIASGKVSAVDFAAEDLEDIDEAHLFIAFTEQPLEAGRNRGGRHVELGYALACERWGVGIEVWIVGPRENVFCWCPEIRQFETWEEALAQVKRDPELLEVGGEG